MPRHPHNRREDSVRYWPTSSAINYVPVVQLAQISDDDWRRLTTRRRRAPIRRGRRHDG